MALVDGLRGFVPFSQISSVSSPTWLATSSMLIVFFFFQYIFSSMRNCMHYNKIINSVKEVAMAISKNLCI